MGQYNYRFKLSVIIPYYNEISRINYNVETLISFLLGRKNIEIIYVDDGSHDRTSEILKHKILNHHHYLHLNTTENNILFRFESVLDGKNLGKGGAVKTGVLMAQGEYILYTDFDMAISLLEVDKFLSTLEELPNKRGVIVASRMQNSAVLKNQSSLRKFMGLIFNQMMKMIINLPIKDTQCGFKMFDTTTAKSIFQLVNINGFAFDVEVLKRALMMNVPVVEQGVEIFFDDRYSTVNVYIDPLKMLLSLVKFRFSLSQSGKSTPKK